MRVRTGDRTGAIADLSRAIALRPGSPIPIAARANAYAVAKRWEEAGRDLLLALQLAPANSVARENHVYVVRGLVREGWKNFESGNRAAALRQYDLATELAPLDEEVGRYSAWLVLGKECPATIERRARNDPRDFRKVQQWAYSLARQGNHARARDAWTSFLMTNPAHPRARLGRAAAQFVLGDYRASFEDAKLACDLGLREACVRMRKIAERLRASD